MCGEAAHGGRGRREPRTAEHSPAPGTAMTKTQELGSWLGCPLTICHLYNTRGNRDTANHFGKQMHTVSYHRKMNNYNNEKVNLEVKFSEMKRGQFLLDTSNAVNTV